MKAGISDKAVHVQGTDLPTVLMHSTTKEGFIRLTSHGGDLVSHGMDA